MTTLFQRPQQQQKAVRMPVNTPLAVENAMRRTREEAEDRQGRSSTIMTRGLTASAGKLGQ